MAFCCRQLAASAVQKRAARSKSSWPDSDSDTEDFLNVVSESRRAFVFTESTLDQFCRDHVDGSVVHDPAEYVCIALLICINIFHLCWFITLHTLSLDFFA